MKIFPLRKTTAGRFLLSMVFVLALKMLMFWLPAELAGKELPEGLWFGWSGEVLFAAFMAFFIVTFSTHAKEDKREE